MAVALLTAHAPVRRHLYIVGLFDGDPTCRFCRVETETLQRIICCCEVLARQRCSVYGKLFAEPKDKSRASVRDLCLFIRGTGLLNLRWMECLGLHNKPKAEVHPEHLLTDPKEKEESAYIILYRSRSFILWYVCMFCNCSLFIITKDYVSCLHLS
jgi:hypothetical protein